MKKSILFSCLLIFLVVWCLTGCNNADTIFLESINMDKGYLNEDGIHLDEVGSFAIPLEGSTGRIRLQLSDDTESGPPSDDPVTLTLRDENDDLLATVSGNPLDGLSLVSDFPGHGTLICEKGMGSIRLTIAHASNSSETLLHPGKTQVQLTSPAGTSEYTLTVNENRVVSIQGKTALLPEEDCSFSIINDQDPLISDVVIHSTEWNERIVYVPKGSYRVIFHDLDAGSISQCTVELVEGLDPVTNDGDSITEAVPLDQTIVLGFTQTKEKWILVDAAQGKHIIATAHGLDNYYDRETVVDVKVYDQHNDLIYTNDKDMPLADFDLPKDEGKYLLQVILPGTPNGVVKVTQNDS
ncbi:hypothetical protein J0B03_11835 [Alkalibacter rhizosphaerae]|uniref:Uncharacterized protein n=1 Tax=Alkalibacter rhizosphaerae TaxID=2815577 RepID=A0A974XEQ4_9FIRM|nr:hypothetical protein [Alkalibacter rhizosphaerae]QSX08458.1 hypothetical protein J0B03_11835 [Alkalibacter rhizosphaerae]